MIADPDQSPCVAVADATELMADFLASALRVHGIVATVPDRTGWQDLPGDAVVLLDAARAVVRSDPARRAVLARPEACVLLLVDDETQTRLQLARQLQAAGWVSRRQTVTEVAVAVERNSARRSTRRPVTRESGGVAGQALTSREKEVLTLVASGHGDEAIAQQLAISVHTVRSHLQSIRTKLGASSRFSAVSIGRSLGLVGGSAADGPR